MTLKSHQSVRFLAVLVLSAAVASPASAALIDFDSLALDEFVTNQFSAEGIVFNNAVTLVAGISLNEIDFPPSSGTNVVSGLDLGPIEAAFPLGTSHVSLQMTTAMPARVQFFDSLDALLTEILVAPNLGAHTLVSFDSLSPIARVTVGDDWMGSAFFLTVDDVEFAASAVPEPATVTLMALGLLPLAAAVIRRRRG